MARLKEIIEKLEDVDESFRALYVGKDGQFVLDIEGEEVSDAKTSLHRERKAARAAVSVLKQFTRELGIADPLKAIDGLRQFRELELRDLVGPGKWEAAVEKRAEQVAAELKSKETTLGAETEKLRSRLEEVQTENAVRSAATKAGIIPSAMDDAVSHARRFWSLKDGALIGKDGQERLFSPADPTRPMNLDEWIGERRQDRAHWFSATVPAPPKQNGHARGVVTLTRDQAKDPAAYRSAKEEAEKVGGRILIVE